MKCISQYAKSQCNAGPKAKVDIEKILKYNYQSKIYTFNLTGNESKYNKIQKFILKVKKAIFSLLFLHGNELSIVQVPFLNDVRFTNGLKNKVAFIHDLEGIRKQDSKIEARELKFLSTCKYIIAHNNKMKEFLIQKGIPESRIFVLELFDYLCSESIEKNSTKELKEDPEVIYTGNLDKAPFIHQLDETKMKFSMNVYGVCENKINNNKINYRGKFLPDEIPNKIEGNLGLVWDGNYDESDEDEGFKNYTKYNNPHKLSCYIAAGIPVIVWEKSAVAELVEKYNIGYIISNVYDINNLEFNDYSIKLDNVKLLSNKIKEGYFTKKILKEILDKEDNRRN